MGRRKNTIPNDVSDERIAWLRRALSSVAYDLGRARKSRSWSACAALHRQSQSLRGELDGALLDRARDMVASTPRDDLTPEEVMRAETSHAAELADVHLHVYVCEYLSRHPGLHLASADGPIEVIG